MNLDNALTWTEWVKRVEAELAERGLTGDVLVGEVHWEPPPNGIYITFHDEQTGEIIPAVEERRSHLISIGED